MHLFGVGSAAAITLMGLASHAVTISAAPVDTPSHSPSEGSGDSERPRPPYRLPQYVVNTRRANAVKHAFQVSWDGYYKYAFPHDSLKPIVNSYEDDREVFVNSLPHHNEGLANSLVEMDGVRVPSMR